MDFLQVCAYCHAALCPLSTLPPASRTAQLSKICGGEPLQLPKLPFYASAFSKKSHSSAGRCLAAPSGSSCRHRWDKAMQHAKSASTAHGRTLCSRLCWLLVPSALHQQIPPCLPDGSISIPGKEPEMPGGEVVLPKQPGKRVTAPGMNSGLISWLLRQGSPLKMQCPLLSPTGLSPKTEPQHFTGKTGSKHVMIQLSDEPEACRTCNNRKAKKVQLLQPSFVGRNKFM